VRENTQSCTVEKHHFDTLYTSFDSDPLSLSLSLSYIYHRHIHASSPASLRREHICIGFTTVNDTARLRILKMYDPAL